MTAKLEARIEYVASLAESASNALGEVTELRAEIVRLEKKLAGDAGNDQDQLVKIARAVKELAALSARLAKIEKWFAPVKTAAGVAIPKILHTLAGASREAGNQRDAELTSGIAAELDVMRIAQKNALADAQGTLRQIVELGNSTVLAATHRLQNASRKFTSGTSVKSSNRRTLKTIGVIENAIVGGLQ
jgi:hypothetical protein